MLTLSCLQQGPEDNTQLKLDVRRIEEERIQVLNNMEELELKIKDLDNQMEESTREVQQTHLQVREEVREIRDGGSSEGRVSMWESFACGEVIRSCDEDHS